MSLQPHTSGKGWALTVMIVVGSILMLLTLVGSLLLYSWGHTRPAHGGEQWNDVIATITVVFLGPPTFALGLFLVRIRRIQSVRGKKQAAVAADRGNAQRERENQP